MQRSRISISGLIVFVGVFVVTAEMKVWGVEGASIRSFAPQVCSEEHAGGGGDAGCPPDPRSSRDAPRASDGASRHSSGDEGGDGASGAWKDPYPAMLADNDRAFVGTKWHPGPMVGGNLLEYLAQVPSGDTTAMAMIVIGGGNDDSLMAHRRLYSRALVVFIGPNQSPDSGGGHNGWLLDKSNEHKDSGCSPVCPAWMFVPPEAIRDVLVDLAKHVRFAHDRVQMFANNFTRYDIYRALDPMLQPYFAGVAHGVYAEWQQATCPDAAKPSVSPPRIFFSWGGCDESFCPTMDCRNTLESRGYTIDPSSKGDTTLGNCLCPGGARPHFRPAGAGTREATYDWLLSNVRK